MTITYTNAGLDKICYNTGSCSGAIPSIVGSPSTLRAYYSHYMWSVDMGAISTFWTIFCQGIMDIGQKVKVKSWDKMVQEYGLHKDGHIVHDGRSFLPMMRQYCNRRTFIEDTSGDMYLLTKCSTWAFPIWSLE